MTNYGQNGTDGMMRQSPCLLLWNYSGKFPQKMDHLYNLGERSHESCRYIMRIKGGRMICKVSRGKTLKTDPRRIFSQTLTASYFVQDIRPTLCATCPWKGEADENLPKWSWSPLSRSSSWSWSRSSVSCDVVVHQPNCRGPCCTFDSWAKGSLLLQRSCPACICDTVLSLARPHVGFPKEGIELNSKRVKRKHNHRWNS